MNIKLSILQCMWRNDPHRNHRATRCGNATYLRNVMPPSPGGAQQIQPRATPWVRGLQNGILEPCKGETFKSLREKSHKSVQNLTNLL